MFVVKLLRDQQRYVMIDPSKKGCIECQPIVLLPKTMINLRAWCCFHHNPHHPVVRTVVADQTMIAESVLKFSCPYSTLRAATNVHFLPIYDIAAGWLVVAPSYVSMVMFCTGQGSKAIVECAVNIVLCKML